MNILDQICAERLAAVEMVRAVVPECVIEEMASGRAHHSLKQRLREGGTCVVAEMKKASPSAGLLRPDYDPLALAASYAAAGACGLSVLTEPLHFLGSGEDLRAVRQVTDLPLLRKDFMVDPYQITESAALGADVVLLIAAALSDEQMRRLYKRALCLGLDVLAEVHTREELDRVLPFEEAIIGVNSRNLKTLKTDLAIAHALAVDIPSDRLSIAESGISCREEILALEQAGYNGFLIGESLLRSGNPGEALAALRSTACGLSSGL